MVGYNELNDIVNECKGWSTKPSIGEDNFLRTKLKSTHTHTDTNELSNTKIFQNINANVTMVLE